MRRTGFSREKIIREIYAPPKADCGLAGKTGRNKYAAMPTSAFRVLLSRYGNTPEGIQKLAKFVEGYEQHPLRTIYAHPIISIRCARVMEVGARAGKTREELWRDGSISSQAIVHASSQSELGGDAKTRKKIFELCIQKQATQKNENLDSIRRAGAWAQHVYTKASTLLIMSVFVIPVFAVIRYLLLRDEPIRNVVIRLPVAFCAAICIMSMISDVHYLLAQKLASGYRRYFKHSE